MDITDYYSLAWNKLVKPDIDRVTALWNSQRDQINQEIQKQNLAAQQQATSYVDTTLNNAIQSAFTTKIKPDLDSIQRQIKDVQDYKAGKINTLTLGRKLGGGETWNPDGVPRDSWYVDHTLESLQRKQQELSDPFMVKRLALEELTNDYSISRNNINDVERQFRENLYYQALPQAEAYLVNPLYGKLESISYDFTNQLTNLNNQGNQTVQSSVDNLFSYLRKREDEANSEIRKLSNAGEWTPEKAQAIREAQKAEEQFLMSSPYAFTPEAYSRSPQVYEQTYQQFLSNIPKPITPEEFRASEQTRENWGVPVYNPVAPEQQTPTTEPQVSAPVTAPVVEQTAPLAAPVTQQPVTQPPLAAPVTQPTAPLAAPVTQQTPQTAAQQPTVAQPAMPVAQQPAPSFLGGIPVGLQPTATPSVQPTGITMATTPLNPENLPALRAAGGGGASAIDPTLRPYLELGLRAAEQQFLQNVPQFFPGQTYVSPSQQTLDALAAQEQIARQAPTTLQAAQESYMRGLGGLGATAGGAFLMGNPYQQQMIQAATRPIMQQFEEQTLPGIASGFSQAGRYGSGAMERALGRATEATSRAIGDVSTNIAFQDYGAERGRQQQAILGQITAAGQAPQIYGQQFLPSQQLAQIGAAREAIAGLPLQEQMQRFQFAQQAPRESLQSFLSSVYGTPLAGSQYAPQQQAQTNRAGNVFGGLATGAGIGSMLGGTTGAGYGAALGALGGLLL